MLLFPAIDWSNDAGESAGNADLRLPCPAADWTQLLLADEQTVTRLLRSNPTVLLFACSLYAKQYGHAARSWDALTSWADEKLAKELCRQLMDADAPPAVVREPACSRKIGKAILGWATIGQSADIKQPLARFLAAATGRTRKSLRQSWPAWLPGELKLPQITDQSVATSLRVWTSPEPLAAAEQVLRLLRLKHDSFETQTEFNERLQAAKLESMKQLAYGASHEINNPLANIATRAQALVNAEHDVNKRHKLATIYEQAMRAHEMISDMMLFANPPQLKIEQTDLRLLIPSVIRSVEESLATQQQFHGKTIEWSVTLGPKLVPVRVDPTQLAVLVHSLVKNSLEAIENTGAIELDVRLLPSGQTQISVSDDGVGVCELAKPHLFDPFYSGREAGRGLGFGLSKAWRIAQLHNGSLTHDETYSPGARFVVQLPALADTVLLNDHANCSPDATTAASKFAAAKVKSIHAA